MNSLPRYPTRTISLRTFTVVRRRPRRVDVDDQAGAERRLDDGPGAREEANAIATLSPALKTFATNYINSHK
jgi:hypothetical protein